MLILDKPDCRSRAVSRSDPHCDFRAQAIASAEPEALIERPFPES